MKHNFRVVPWWVDDSILFLNNMFKWYPNILKRALTVLEIGGGNSTLYLLNKRCKVTTIEGDRRYIDYITTVAKTAGFTVGKSKSFKQKSENDLSIIEIDPYERKRFNEGHWYNSLSLDNEELKFDILINDGIDRVNFLKKFTYCHNSILIIDNCEVASNWGRLTKSSADPKKVKIYRNFLRDCNWNKIIFEQGEGRDGRSIPDFTGIESDHRSITTIAWHYTHFFNSMMLTSKGYPVVNPNGENDDDLITLKDRFPYDKKNKQWVKKEKYPKTLNQKLKRNYD